VVPRASLGDWTPAPDRDPLGVLSAQDKVRDQDLVPLRHSRMGVSPFTFYRGAAAVMAADLAPMPRTGLDVQLCGDAHLANFGVFASPDRAMVFDLNDFDETHPGPFEWDLRRLVASFEVAARDRSFDDPQRVQIVADSVLSYVSAMRQYSTMSNLEVWYDRLTVDDIAQRWAARASDDVLRRFRRNVDKARSKDRIRAFDKLVEVTDGTPRFRSDPPVLVPVRELVTGAEHAALMKAVDESLKLYRRTLAPDRRLLMDRYRFVDVALKVVGVGSVGTRCYIALVRGRDDDDLMILQIKEAEHSVLEPYVDPIAYENQGHRVVVGQHLMQAATDQLLGWSRVGDNDYYIRQFRDMKGSVNLERVNEKMAGAYLAMCAWTLARAHARSGSRIAIASYLGKGTNFDAALVEFSLSYAEQVARDYERFAAAASDGRIEVAESAY